MSAMSRSQSNICLDSAAAPAICLENNNTVTKNHNAQMKKVLDHEQASPIKADAKPMRGKKRFDNKHKSITSTKINVYQFGKPPSYKQTIKRWAY